MTNWILTKKIELTTIDKLKELLKHSYKLVLVQQHELEKLRAKKLHQVDRDYINNLYQHYIVEGKGKTYNVSSK